MADQQDVPLEGEDEGDDAIIAQQNAGGKTQPEAPKQTPTDYESWFGTLDEPSKALLTGHTAGLKKALDSERESQKKLRESLKAAKAAAEKGTELEASLTKLETDLEVATKRAQFYESAPSGLTNARLAWIMASTDDLFTKKGDPDWEEIRKRAPELFVSKKATPSINAGSGQSGSSPATGPSMNAFIRAAAGRGSSS